MPLYKMDGKLALFVHVPKAGGTTIEFCLARYCVGFLDREFRPGVFPCSPQHFHGKMIEQLFNVKELDYIFMTVRHPVSRLKSEYKWRRRFFKLETEFNEWLVSSLAAFQKNNFVYDNHLRPMVDFLLPSAEVFKLEDGLSAVTARLEALMPGTKLALSPGHEMSSGDAPENLALSKDALSLVENIYREDFDRFGY
ncbi:sulfotransferase family 2 domain-containing protein [Methylocystis sp. ATCC 49242]|uniref:sulfotransferase family 2 domain-containing protein n=1 Tax=Methylocystis sp. ATCC 49242 TaxID=622637 RepID=UPI0001F867E8|nr:sulfotransferase family 2 domain-containing protein [Methylocystis sp. ATCC 49242]